MKALAGQARNLWMHVTEDAIVAEAEICLMLTEADWQFSGQQLLPLQKLETVRFRANAKALREMADYLREQADELDALEKQHAKPSRQKKLPLGKQEAASE